MSPINRVIHYWLHDPVFSYASTQPRELPLNGEAGFEGLVKRYAGDLPVGAVRSELESRGVISVNENELCTLRVRFLRFAEDKEDLIHGILFNVRNILETAEYNFRVVTEIGNQEPTEGLSRRFERSVWSNRLSPDGADAFNDWLESHGQAFLEEANGFITAREVHGDDDSSDGRVIGVGMYFYQQDGEND